MKLKTFFVLLFLPLQVLFSQEGFVLEENLKKTIIPFEIYNNLIVIQVEVNNVPLKFLLDTGIQESIIFSIDESNEINFSQVQKIKVKGFGDSELYDGYKSSRNNLKIKNFVDTHHTLYIILNQELNISTQVGIPINGIIGYYFFKNHLVKINYESKKIIVYNNKEKQLEKIQSKYSKIDLDFLNNKPYVNTNVFLENKNEAVNAKLLLDIGNSDAIWLFKNQFKSEELPKTTLNDFLGRGLSSDVYGDRARINKFSIGEFQFKKPLVAFPDNENINNFDSTNNRSGSLGSEIMRRFTSYYDYQSNSLYIKKNSYFNDAFSFNMSGMEVHHQGVQWIKQTYQEGTAQVFNVFSDDGDKSVTKNLQYKFELKPVYIISSIRKNSPADLAGLQKDDVIVRINKRNGYNFKLQEISELLKSEEGKTIEFEIERNGKLLKFKFQLKSII